MGTSLKKTPDYHRTQLVWDCLLQQQSVGVCVSLRMKHKPQIEEIMITKITLYQTPVKSHLTI